MESLINIKILSPVVSFTGAGCVSSGERRVEVMTQSHVSERENQANYSKKDSVTC